MKITKILTSIFAFMAISCAAAGCSFGMAQNSANGSNECKHTIIMDEAVAPTCGADGLTAGCHCSTCGEILVEQGKIPATNEHQYIEWNYDNDYHWQTCDCGAESEKVEHAYKTETIAPTKTEDGYDVHTCDCNKMYQDNYTDATGSIGLEYTLNADGNSYTVVGIGSCEDTDLVIPKKYNKKPVISIGYQAFSGCGGLTSVRITNR